MANFSQKDKAGETGSGMGQSGQNSGSGGNVASQVKAAGQKMGDEAKKMSDKATDEAKGMASNVMHKAEDAASFVGQKASDAASYLGHRTEDATGSVAHTMKSLGGSIREYAPREGMMGSAGQAVAEGLETGSRYLEEHGLRDIGDDLTNMIRRNPIPALLLGIGVGYLLARATRS
jgi:hypothetical protein